MNELLRFPEGTEAHPTQVKAVIFGGEALRSVTAHMSKNTGVEMRVSPLTWRFIGDSMVDARNGLCVIMGQIIHANQDGEYGRIAVMDSSVSLADNPDDFHHFIHVGGVASDRSLTAVQDAQQRLAQQTNSLLEQLQSPLRLP